MDKIREEAEKTLKNERRKQIWTKKVRSGRDRGRWNKEGKKAKRGEWGHV